MTTPARHRRVPSGTDQGQACFGTVDQSKEPCEQDPSGRWVRYPVLLGRGACKRVFWAFDCENGLEVAWNQVELLGAEFEDCTREKLLAEINVLKQLHHKNIMSFMDYWYNPRNRTLNFITEIFRSGTLRQYRKKLKLVNEGLIARWAYQILEGLVYLHGHEPPIVHRDLKCDNIFVRSNTGQVKIGDLGLATAQQGLSVVGTPEFMAPEIYEEQYDEKVDIYSFGMCLLELATLEYPYSECHGVAQIFRKVTTGVKPQALQRVGSTQLRELIELCIAHDPKDRPEARKLLKHPFFNEIRSELSLHSSHANLAALGSHHPSCSNLALSLGATGGGGNLGGVVRTEPHLTQLSRALQAETQRGVGGQQQQQQQQGQASQQQLQEGQQQEHYACEGDAGAAPEPAARASAGTAPPSGALLVAATPSKDPNQQRQLPSDPDPALPALGIAPSPFVLHPPHAAAAIGGAVAAGGPDLARAPSSARDKPSRFATESAKHSLPIPVQQHAGSAGVTAATASLVDAATAAGRAASPPTSPSQTSVRQGVSLQQQRQQQQQGQPAAGPSSHPIEVLDSEGAEEGQGGSASVAQELQPSAAPRPASKASLLMGRFTAAVSHLLNRDNHHHHHNHLNHLSGSVERSHQSVNVSQLTHDLHWHDGKGEAGDEEDDDDAASESSDEVIIPLHCLKHNSGSGTSKASAPPGRPDARRSVDRSAEGGPCGTSSDRRSLEEHALRTLSAGRMVVLSRATSLLRTPSLPSPAAVPWDATPRPTMSLTGTPGQQQQQQQQQPEQQQNRHRRILSDSTRTPSPGESPAWQRRTPAEPSIIQDDVVDSGSVAPAELLGAQHSGGRAATAAAAAAPSVSRPSEERSVSTPSGTSRARDGATACAPASATAADAHFSLLPGSPSPSLACAFRRCSTTAARRRRPSSEGDGRPGTLDLPTSLPDAEEELAGSILGAALPSLTAHQQKRSEPPPQGSTAGVQPAVGDNLPVSPLGTVPPAGSGASAGSKAIYGVIVRVKQCKGRGFTSSQMMNRLRRAASL